MADEYDFGPEEAASFGSGILGGEGVNHHTRATVKPDKAGICIYFVCDGCGVRNQMIVEWPELVIGSTSRLPPKWFHDENNGVMIPEMGCAAMNCRRQVNIGLTPDECMRHIKQAVASGRISTQWVNNAIQQLNAGPTQGVSR